jgi:precorrin-6B methylase 2
MKSFLKWTLERAVKHDGAWHFINATLVRASDYAKMKRLEVRGREPTESDVFVLDALRCVSPSLTVRSGPFKGMRYPSGKSLGSTLAPKILGSYESELAWVMEEICSKPYSQIIDIGCAEGYYAVGLAMRIGTAKVIAFDINEEAIAACLAMARINGVADRLVTRSFCDAEALQNVPLTEKALIISDCEGYEKELFTAELVPHLAKHDLLIEVHDFMDIEISSLIRQRFQGTHCIATIRSVDDITKAHTYSFTELEGFSLAQKRQLLAEGRPAIMEWLYMTPIQIQSDSKAAAVCALPT